MTSFNSKTFFSSIRKYSKRLIYSLLIIIPVAILGFWGYTEFASYSADQETLDSAYADRNVKIEEKVSYYEITPIFVRPDAKAIIFYPGGLVRPQSYIAKMVKISEIAQTKVFLIKSPFNLGFFDIGAAGRIIEQNALSAPIVAGHSLGGVAACRYLKENPDRVSGIYLYGSYCDQSIVDFEGTVLSVIGENDQILDRESYEKAKSNLPTQTNYREIPDLNHSSFGDYGLQKGDGSSGQSIENVVKAMIN
jgi:hypothetical protein